MFRNKVKASLLTLGLGAAVGLTAFSQASAQDPDVYFYPAKSWTVGLSSVADNVSGERHCAIQSEFNNGFVVQFNGSNEWVESFSINFRQSIFNQGQSYDVALQIPGKEGRTLSAMANKDNVLTISLKGRKGLYQAIRTSSVLDVDVEGNEFRFYLVGFAKASDGFERCMAGGSVEPVTPKVALAPILGAPVSEEAPLASHTMNEAIAYEDAEIHNVPLTEILPEIPVMDVAEIEARPPSFEPVVPADHVPRKRMSEQLAEDIARNPDIIGDEPLKARVAMRSAVETGGALLPPPMEMTSEGGASRASVTPAKSPAKAMETVVEKAKAQAKPSEEKGGLVKTVTTKIKRHVKKYSGSADLSAVGIPHRAAADSDVVGRISGLERTIQELKGENVALNDELRSALTESKNERLTITSENWNLERATMRFNESERQLKRMGQKLQQERAQCSTQKRDLEAMLFDPKVTNEKQLARLADLEQQLLKANEDLESQRLRYEDRLRISEGR